MDAMQELIEYKDQLEKFKEANRLRYDFYKHLTTLCLGAILFMAAFLGREITVHVQRISIILAVFFFLISLCVSVFIMTDIGDIVTNAWALQAAAVSIDKDKDRNSRDQIAGLQKRIKHTSKIVLFSFTAGVICIVGFLVTSVL
ncbi:MAG: hypothetical protein KA243_01075 [Candidatus Aminicenantes bacterium]|nr:hypothetical protein [Candidatus Aminicenantes bacterium]